MTELPQLKLKKSQERRLKAGHLWIYSNEIDTKATPLKNFTPGEEVLVTASNNIPLGVAYVNPHSLITARLFSRNSKTRLNHDFFTKRIIAALNLRKNFFDKPFYRLIFSDSDYLPGLVIDRFNETLVMQITTQGMEAKIGMIMDSVLENLPETKTIVLRNDSQIRKLENLSNYTKIGFGESVDNLYLEENNVKFHAPLTEGQKTGWFFDHRENRARLAKYVQNKKTLDVFSYLGGWGIQAAVFGAKEVLCIDSSSLSQKWITKNAELNGVENKVKTITQDAFHALKDLHQNKNSFDLIITDPPAFVKKQKDLKEGLIAYQRIHEQALKLLEPEGILVACSCSMHVSHHDFLQTIRRASLNTQCELQILEQGGQSVDHPTHIAIPETNYLKMFILRKNKSI